MGDTSDHPKHLKLILTIGNDDEFYPDDPQPTSWTFYEWKGYDSTTYWRVNFATQFSQQQLETTRRLPNYKIHWEQFTQTTITVAHLVAVASRKYTEEPFQNTDTHTRPDTLPNPHRPDLRLVPFGELLHILCPDCVQNYHYRYIYSAIYYSEETGTTHPIDNPEFALPKSLFTTTLRILLESLTFLVHIGFVKIDLGEYTDQGRLQLSNLPYGHIAHLLDNTLELLFSVAYKSDKKWTQVLEFFKASIPYETRRNYLTYPPDRYRFDDRAPYWCPYVTKPGETQD